LAVVAALNDKKSILSTSSWLESFESSHPRQVTFLQTRNVAKPRIVAPGNALFGSLECSQRVIDSRGTGDELSSRGSYFDRAKSMPRRTHSSMRRFGLGLGTFNNNDTPLSTGLGTSSLQPQVPPAFDGNSGEGGMLNISKSGTSLWL